MAQQSRCPDRVFHRLLLDRVIHFAHLGGVDFRALVISQHGHAAAGQAFGQIREYFVRINGFIAVVGTGTMYQNHRREGRLANGNQQGSAQFPGIVADRHFALAE